ncbi:restriction endonuclease subunit S [Aerococcus viridans]|uniref:restriction endonuclease subunit S n=1 Tax=Aerococcus viridans TaxID=1377 RepID=UPI003B221A82
MSINKDSQKAPNLRFKGFTDDWKQRKLGKIADVKDSARISNELWVENGIPYLRSSDLVNGELNGELFISNDTYEKYASKTGAPQKDDVLFTSGGKVGIVYHKMDDSPVYVQGGAVLYVKTSTSVLLEGSFLSVYFSSPKMQLYLDIASSGGTIKHFTLKPANSSPIVFPSISEQSKIGQFFKTLDDTITLHQRKLDQLIQLKEALLQQMFPGKGETVPKLRFAGFEGDWEQRKLGSIYDFSKGKGLPLDSFTHSKDDPAIAYGHLYTKYSEVISEVYLSSDDDGVLSKENDLLFPGSSTVPNGTAQANAIMLNNVKLGGDIIIARPKQDIRVLSIFMSYQINSQRQKLFPITVGTTIAHMYGKDLSKVKFFMTNYSEQEKIGSFFQYLDDTITLQQRKLDQLQNMKQVLLQNMFI